MQHKNRASHHTHSTAQPHTKQIKKINFLIECFKIEDWRFTTTLFEPILKTTPPHIKQIKKIIFLIECFKIEDWRFATALFEPILKQSKN